MGGIVDAFDKVTFGVTGAGAAYDYLTDNSGTGVSGAISEKVNEMGGGGGVNPDSGVASFNINSSMGSGGLNAATGELTSNLSPEMQWLFNQGTNQAARFNAEVPRVGRQASELSGGFLSEAGAFDPFAAAEEQFNRLDSILEPGRTKQRSGAAGGLLSTGRLGSTSGNDLQAQIEAQIENQRQGLLSEQFTAAQGVQDSMINRGTNLGAFGLQQQLGTQQLGTGALSNSLNIDSQLQALLGLGSNATKTQPLQTTEGGGMMDALVQGGIAGLVSLI